MSDREPIQERAQLTRTRLLKAAIHAFAERGYDAIGTREIEAAAGVNRGLITYHFGSKEALWKAAMEELFEDHAADLALEPGDDEQVDPAERLADVIRAFVRYCAAHPEVNRIMVQEGKHDDWRLAWIVERYVEPYYAATKTVYERAVAAGVAPPMDHLHFHYILTGGAALMFAMAPECRLLSGRDPNDQALVEAHADTLISLLLPGASNETRNLHARTADTNRSRRGRQGRRSQRGGADAADRHEGVSRGRRKRVDARKKR
jgi:AcrR family transcriptional regulator